MSLQARYRKGSILQQMKVLQGVFQIKSSFVKVIDPIFSSKMFSTVRIFSIRAFCLAPVSRIAFSWIMCLFSSTK